MNSPYTAGPVHHHVHAAKVYSLDFTNFLAADETVESVLDTIAAPDDLVISNAEPNADPYEDEDGHTVEVGKAVRMTISGGSVEDGQDEREYLVEVQIETSDGETEVGILRVLVYPGVS